MKRININRIFYLWADLINHLVLYVDVQDKSFAVCMYWYTHKENIVGMYKYK